MVINACHQLLQYTKVKQMMVTNIIQQLLTYAYHGNCHVNVGNCCIHTLVTKSAVWLHFDANRRTSYASFIGSRNINQKNILSQRKSILMKKVFVLSHKNLILRKRFGLRKINRQNSAEWIIRQNYILTSPSNRGTVAQMARPMLKAPPLILWPTYLGLPR